MRDQVRMCLVDRDASDPLAVGELMGLLGIADPYYQQVYAYLRKLEREDRAERWSRPNDSRVLWSATSKMRSEFEIRLPPMRTRNPGPPNRRIKR